MAQHSSAVLSLFFDLQHGGEFSWQKRAGVQQVGYGSRVQGGIIELFVAWSAGKVAHTAFKAYGNVLTIASAEYLCRWLIGKDKAQLAQLSARQIEQDLQLSHLDLPVVHRLLGLVRQLSHHQ